MSRQSPSAVHLGELGGEDVVYPTDVFVGLNPRRLSEGFRIVSTFGIDYRHQAIATTEVPERMREQLEQGLLDLIAREHIKSVAIYFQLAAASSLDYEIHVDLTGEAAPHAQLLRHAIQPSWSTPATRTAGRSPSPRSRCIRLRVEPRGLRTMGLGDFREIPYP
jgi:hypothetical protein